MSESENTTTPNHESPASHISTPAPDSTLEPEEYTHERATEVWSEITRDIWKRPMIIKGSLEPTSQPQMFLDLSDTSLLDSLLEADRALPDESQIMTKTKLTLRASRVGDDYKQELTASPVTVGRFSISPNSEEWHGLFPSHDMTATLAIGVKHESVALGTIPREDYWPRRLVADLGDASLADRHRAFRERESIALECPAQDRLLLPIQRPRDPSYFRVKLSDPSIYMFDGTGPPDLDRFTAREDGSFSTSFPLHGAYLPDKWKFSFEAPDERDRTRERYNIRNERLGVHRPVADIQLHLEFTPRTTSTEDHPETM